MTHEIQLEQYRALVVSATPWRRLCLGTKSSYGAEKLHLLRGCGWDGLTLDVSFQPGRSTALVTVLADEEDTVLVPPEATASATEEGRLTIRGVQDGVQRISVSLRYAVLNHADTPGQALDATQSIWQQYAARVLPRGGTAGQVLTKASDAALDLCWTSAAGVAAAAPRMLTNAGRSDRRAVVSLIDDDCRTETYTKLFPLIRQLGIPYTVACPAGLIGTQGRMTEEQLLEMVDSGVTVACHTMTESDMEESTPDELDAALSAFQAQMIRWGIQPVRSYAYVNGRYREDCLNTVKRYFDLGLTVERGINRIPYESYRMKRVEVFPTNGAYSLDDVKAYVDETAANGGWLILMTHAWYSSFSASGLEDLVACIRQSGAALMDLNEALSATGNVVEAGSFQKPAEDAAQPFFVVDADGRAWTNAVSDLRPADGIENAALSLQSGRYLAGSTGESRQTADSGYKVTDPVRVAGYAQVLITAWAYQGCALYAFLDEDGAPVRIAAAQTAYADGGDTLLKAAVPVPDGAVSLVAAGNLYWQLPAVKLISSQNLLSRQTALSVAWHTNYVLKISGSTVNYPSDDRVISEKISASPGEVYLLTCSANWNNALYVVYDSDGNVLAYRQSPNTADGETVSALQVTMPESTACFRVASNLTLQPDSFAVVQKTTRMITRAPALTVSTARQLLNLLRAAAYSSDQSAALTALEDELLR